jgi:L,D-transpeptidase catalytic domain.
MIIINISKQTLSLYDNDQHLIAEYPISSAAKGLGEIKGSNQTPRGPHIIHQKNRRKQPHFFHF